MSMGGALVIFVKTPGFSPVKTRLAQSIGKEMAEEFFYRSVAATRAYAKVLRDSTAGLTVYWAVAEQAGLSAPLWSHFPVISQGEGGLGERLDHVYREILTRHDFACFIGSDSPHLLVRHTEAAIMATKNFRNSGFTLGETSDGGFYFFGGSLPIPTTLWTSVIYSAPTTARDLTAQLRVMGDMHTLPQDFDIDTLEDLQRLAALPLDDMLPEQVSLIQWARTCVGSIATLRGEP